MKHKIPEELISAYIDGELTSDEQVLVEQALCEDPQSRQLLEDLQSLHDRLQSIPRSEPSQDYTQQILRRAERAILTGEIDTHPTPSDPQSTADETSSSEPLTPVVQPPPPRNWQHLIWATTALAALLLLALLFHPSRVENKNTSQVANTTGESSKDNPATKLLNADTEITTPSETARTGIDRGRADVDQDKEQAKFVRGNEAAGDSPAGKTLLYSATGNDDAAPAPSRRASALHEGEESELEAGQTEDPLVLYVSLSQQQFNELTIVRTLVAHDIPFTCHPSQKGGFRDLVRHSKLDGKELPDLVAAEADDEKLTKSAGLRRNEAATENKKDEHSRDRKQQANGISQSAFRVITIETTPETLGPLVQTLATEDRLPLPTDPQADSGSAGRRKRAALNSSVNRETLQRLQALSIKNDKLLTADEISRSLARKPVPAETQAPKKPAIQPGKTPDSSGSKSRQKELDKAKSTTNRDAGREKKEEIELEENLDRQSVKGLFGASLKKAATKPTTTVRIVVVVVSEPAALESLEGQAGATAKPADKTPKKANRPK